MHDEDFGCCQDIMAQVLEVRCNIVEAQVDLIVQQCNCLTTNTCGLASVISKQMMVDINSERQSMSQPRNLSVLEDRGLPGSCIIRENLTSHPPKYVACLLAQFAPGKPGKFYKDYVRAHGFTDNAEQRLLWFCECLEALKVEIVERGIRSVAFPKYIGCGLAGGDARTYRTTLDDFIQNLSDNLDRPIIIQIVPYE